MRDGGPACLRSARTLVSQAEEGLRGLLQVMPPGSSPEVRPHVERMLEVTVESRVALDRALSQMPEVV